MCINNYMFFSVASFLFTIIVCFLFFSKSNIKNKETTIYGLMLVILIAEAIFEILLRILANNFDGLYILNCFTAKTFLCLGLSWFLLITLYNCSISHFLSNKYDELKKGAIICLIIASILIFIFPIEFFFPENADYYSYTYGASVNVFYMFFGLLMFFNVVLIFIDRSYIRNKKYLPLIMNIILYLVVAVIQKSHPEILLNLLAQGLTAFLMYHTIENPDLKMVKELYDNRKLIEKTNEDKLNLLFELSQEIKQPIKNIEKLSNDIITVKDKEKIVDIAMDIKNNSKQLSLMTNNILDVSTMDIRNIKIDNQMYKPKVVFDGINSKIKSELENKNIDFRYKISSDIADVLYGDPVKLKQILIALLNKSIKDTKEGFIELNINSIIKYDVCRLIISISDSGRGMSIEEVNDILSVNDEVDEKIFESLDSLDVGINLAHKIIKVLGGSLIVKSEIRKGSEYLVIIDQKIKETNSKITKNSELSNITLGKKVLIVNDKTTEIKKIRDILTEFGYDVSSSLYGKDAIEKVKNKEKFDLLIIDDDMPQESGINTLEKLKKIKGFNVPSIVTLNKDKEFLCDKYLEDGFDDYILKDKLPEEIKKVKKYI